MNSNEEYLDSLLKAVTGGQGLDTGAEADDNKTETDIENEFILDAPEWDDDEPADIMEDLVLGTEGLDFGDHAAGSGLDEGSSADEENVTEEAALLDPGALFFEGEEETEDDLFLNDMQGDLPLIEEDARDMEDDILFAQDGLAEGNANEDVADVEAEAGESLFDSLEEADLGSFFDETDEKAVEEPAAQDKEADGSEDMEDVGDLESLADIGSDGDAMEGEAELEDLILAADSTEEVMEEGFEDLGSDEEGFQEISDLLANAGDSDEEMLAMLGGVGEEEPADIGFFAEEFKEEGKEAITEAAEEDTKPKKKKERKKKKGKKTDEEAGATGENEADSEETPKKQGALAKFMNFLFEEDEEEDAAGEKQEASIDDLLMGETASDENAAILEELDKENENKKSGKKDKKKKGKKGKAKETAEDGEEGEEDIEEGKAKKPKKEKKKKEKKVKEEEIPEEPVKKLSARKIQVTVLMCLSVTAGIILIVRLVPPTLDKGKARDAYYAKDYEQVLEGFYGEELSESDEIMYQRAMTILKFQRKIDAYNSYMYMGKETEALNQLIEAINRYDEIYEEAVTNNVIGEIDTLYQTVLDALQNRYGLSISRAMEIYAIEDDFEYTLMLESIIDGITYTMPENAGEDQEGNIQEQTPEGQDLEGEAGSQAADSEGETAPEDVPVTE